MAGMLGSSRNAVGGHKRVLAQNERIVSRNQLYKLIKERAIPYCRLGKIQINLTNNNVNDSEPAYSPDGAEIAFRRSNDIYVMNSDGPLAVNRSRILLI